MIHNPYYYTGPLDPEEHKLVFVPRSEEISKIINKITWNQYWAILGPRQIGKSTFLRQIQHSHPQARYIYIDMSLFHNMESEELFYLNLIERLKNSVPHEAMPNVDFHSKVGTPPEKMLDILNKFKPINHSQPIVFLFDEIEWVPFFKNLLMLWRAIYHEKHQKENLKKYVVMIAGAIDLVKETIEAGSPFFNIANPLYLKDFEYPDAKRLIEKPLQHLNISIEEEDEKFMIYHLNGHPQLLQHLCSILVENAMKGNRSISRKDIDKALDELYKINTNLALLKYEVQGNPELEDLVKKVLKGKVINYSPYFHYTYSGTGPIIEGAVVEGKQKSCSIRNDAYKEYLSAILQ